MYTVMLLRASQYSRTKITQNCVSGFESSFSIKTFLSLPTLRICWQHFLVKDIVSFRRFRVVPKSARYLRHVGPFVCSSILSSHWTDFHKIWCWRLLWKSIGELQIWIKSDQDIGHFTLKIQYFFIFAGERNAPWKHFKKQYFDVFYSYMYLINTHRTQFHFPLRQ
jgi:hypothetical protein